MSSDDKVNILLVDDQPAKLLSYEAILAGLGENIVKAASAREALEQLLKQVVAVVAVIAYVSIVSFVLLKAVDALFGLRAPEDAEVEGLDLSLHGETAYQM